MESDLGFKDRIHIRLGREDHRVFWLTQRKIEGCSEEIRKVLKRCVPFLVWEGKKRVR